MLLADILASVNSRTSRPAIDTVADLQQLAAAGQVVAAPPGPAQPWLLRVEQIFLGPWPAVGDPAGAPGADPVHCPSCRSPQVQPKGHRPGLKTYYDDQHQVQQVAVYRYVCANPQCPTQSFTAMPAGLLPYSPYRTEVHLLALQMYAWGYSTYRRTGTALAWPA